MTDKVVVCTVTGGAPNWPYVNSVFSLQAPGEKMFRHIMGKQGVDEGHNLMIEWFLEETDFDWMLHLDSDAVVHHKTLLRLLSWGKPFVSALAVQRKQPFAPVVYKDPCEKDGYFKRQIKTVLEWIGKHPELLKLGKPTVLEPRPDDALYEVDRGGAHCLLTHRSVLEAIPDPWFVRSGERARQGSGSDFTFYKNAQKQGFKTYLDRSVLAGHLSQDLCTGVIDFVVWNNVSRWTPDGKQADVEVELPYEEE